MQLMDPTARTLGVDNSFDPTQNVMGGVQFLKHLLDRYHGDIDRQIKQINAIIGVASTQINQVSNLVDWLDRFVYALPKAVPGDFTQVYMWAVPCSVDPRSPAGCP